MQINGASILLKQDNLNENDKQNGENLSKIKKIKTSDALMELVWLVIITILELNSFFLALFYSAYRAGFMP